MRALAVALCVLGSGCLAEIGGEMSGADCSADLQQEVGKTADALFPPQAVDDPSPMSNPRITVHARPGQEVTAQAIFQATGGTVKPFYDGPAGDVTQGTTVTWQSIAIDAEGGNVTLGLDGDPFAFGVQYTLVLIASGCTPHVVEPDGSAD